MRVSVQKLPKNFYGVYMKTCFLKLKKNLSG